MMKKMLLGAAVAASAMFMASAPADAAILIGLSTDGGATITQVANDGGTGSASFNGLFGTFTINNISGVGFPGVPQPELQTSSINVSGGAAGTLTVFITQTNLNSFTGGLTSSFTSNTFFGAAQSVVQTTYLDTANGLWSGAQLATYTFNGLGSVALGTNLGTVPGLFSETARYDLTFGAGAGSVNDTINLTAVPEPASWAMMLTGFAAVGYSLRRRKAYRLLQAV